MKRIGLISPNLSETTLADAYRILPDGISIVGRPLEVGRFVDSEFRNVERAFVGIVRELVQQPLDFLMITGELFLSYKGPGSDKLILATIKETISIPASTVLTAVIHAGQALELQRVVVASPFPEDQDARLVRFLEGERIQVKACRGLGYDNSTVIWDLPPQTGYDLAASLLNEYQDVDGLYMPCNKWRVTTIIERLEREFGKPVVTNTPAWIWEALREMNSATTIDGFGRLLGKVGRLIHAG